MKISVRGQSTQSVSTPVRSLIQKVVFLVESPFNQRDYERFGIELLQKEGSTVEVWDFTALLYPQLHSHVKVPDPINYEGYHQLSTREEVLAAISELTHLCFVVCMLVYRYETWHIYRALSNAKLKYCVPMTNATPTINSIRGPVHAYAQIIKKLFQYSPERLFKALFCRIPFNCMGIRPATVLLAGGERSIRGSCPISKDTEILWAHSLDYDIFLEEKDKPTQVDMKMGVFLDEYLPFHPDYIHMGVSPPSAPEDYYPILCRFFDLLERECGIQIVIAAHPRAHYEERCKNFGRRRVYKGKTAELVRQSGLTIAHASTSLNFAVLFQKPVLFITTNRLQQSPVAGPYIVTMATWLNKTPINLDELPHIDWEKELTVDQASYARYQEAYIKKRGSPEKPCWQIFADFLKTLEP